MLENLHSFPLWELLAKRNAGQATLDELARLEEWLAQYTLPDIDVPDQIDITFEDEAAMAAWIRMQQRAKLR